MAFPENTVNDTGIKHIWDKVTAALSGKVDKVSGKGLSTNDYTTAEKEKLSGIEAGAQVNAVTSVAGKTGEVTLAKGDVGLGNVDNTSDLDKPISTATQNALDTKADTSEVAGTQTATGNPITITDASETYAQGLSVELEPKQDLHGYDFPWVGGAGKNKLPLTVEGIKAVNTDGTWSGNVYTYNGATFEILVDSDNNVIGITFNSTTNVTHLFNLYSGDVSIFSNMIMNGATGGNTAKFIRFKVGSTNYDDRGAEVNIGTVSGTGSIYIALYNQQNGTFYPMLRLSTETDPTFAPYSNICPITGYTECEVDDVGKNEFNLKGWLDTLGALYTQNGDEFTITAQDNLYTTPFVFSDTDTQVTFSFSAYENVTTTVARASLLDTNGNVIGTIRAGETGPLTGIASKIRFDWSTGGTFTINKAQIELGLTATPYEPFKSTTASVTFGQTVYGGKSNFTEGGTDKLYNVVVVDGSYNITAGAYNMPFMLDLPNDIKASTSSSELSGVLCNMMHEVIQSSSWGTPCTFSRTTNERGTIFFKMQDGLTDIDELKAYLNENPLYFVYPIDTPTTLATPKTDLKLLQDINNLTTNGTTITLDYIPNNSIGDAVKASEEYTDRAVGRVAVVPKATLIDTWMISEEADTISVDLSSYDCNFFLLEYLFNSKRGTTLIPRPQSGSFSASVVTYNNSTPYYIELDYNPTTKELAYTSNVTSQFGILAIYTI